MHAMEPRQHTFETGRVLTLAAVAVAKANMDLVVLARDDRVLHLLREIAERGVHRKAHLLRQRIEHAAEVVGSDGVPWSDSALGERL